MAFRASGGTRAKSMYGREAGITLIGGILVVLIAGVLVLAAARIVPAYIEAGEISSILSSMKPDARTKSVEQLRAELVEQLTMNSINDVDLSEFEISEQRGQLTISIHHPIEKSFIGNLNFLVDYRHSITVTRASDE